MRVFGCLTTVLWGIFGMVIGGWLFGSWGIILGAAVAIGLMAPRAMEEYGDEGGGSWGDSEELLQRRQVFSRIVFLVSGHIAQADGRVSEDEIQCAQQVMRELGLSQEQSGSAMHHFNLGSRPGFDLEDHLRQLVWACRSEPSMIATFIQIQVAMACADGELSPSERKIIHSCCVVLGFPESRLQVFIDQYLGDARRAGPQSAPAGNLDWAYELLEVEAAASMQDVQRAYARKMKEFHPDKLASKGLPQEFMDFATERTKQFTKAYKTIKDAGGAA